MLLLQGKNLGPLYKPFMWLFGLKWKSEEDLDLIIICTGF